ncbi:MAG: hypothetical protein AAF557_18985 [Pseudomonadota bacterium]
MTIDSCRAGGTWHMIDASGGGATLSIVGNTNQDGSTYETLDFMVDDIRASDVNKDKPFQFDGTIYRFSGEVFQSDNTGSSGQIEIEVTC